MLDPGSGVFTAVIRHEGSLAHQGRKVVGVGFGFDLRAFSIHAQERRLGACLCVSHAVWPTLSCF
jgi:hypothetical protein